MNPTAPPEANKKAIVDSGGGEEAALPSPYGAARAWGFGDLMTVPLKVAADSRDVWFRIMAFQGLTAAVPFLNILVSPIVVGLVTTAMDEGVHGKPSTSFTELWSRVSPRLSAMYWTYLCMLMTIGGAVIGSAFFGGAVGTLFGQAMGFMLGGIMLLFTMIQAIKASFFALQVAALEGVSGPEALRISRDAISRNKQALIGGDAIGLIVSVNVVSKVAQSVLKVFLQFTLVPALIAVYPMLIIPGMLLFTAIFLSPFQVYRTAGWTGLYLRGR